MLRINAHVFFYLLSGLRMENVFDFSALATYNYTISVDFLYWLVAGTQICVRVVYT